ncbi:hypothetical protein ACHAXT_004806 [Thalassiosira profunda]
MLETIRAVLKKFGRRKFGYLRSSELTTAGRRVGVHKQAQDCQQRGAPATDALRKRAELANLDVDALLALDAKSLNLSLYRARRHLWTIQKDCADARLAWPDEVAQDRARAEGDPDWEKKLRDVKRDTKARAVNKKITGIIKGPRRPLDCISVPTSTWYYSYDSHEIYRYDQGSFEAYPKRPILYPPYPQSSPRRCSCSKRALDEESQRFEVDEVLACPGQMWTDITTPTEVEGVLLERNRRHLEQTVLEENRVLVGEPITDIEIPTTLAEWLRCMQQSDREKELPPCVGSIGTAEYQEMFLPKHTNQPPLVYGFSNRDWEEMTDYMLEKKPGDRRIHRMRIIGLVCPEFNTALKHFARQFTHNYEASEPSDFQHGARPNRQAQDLAMIKLCTYETSRAGYRPIATTQYDLSAACFDRLFHEISNLNLLRRNVAKPLLRARALIISRMCRSVCTGLGISSRTYEQSPRGPRMTGEIQGKADVPIAFANTTDGILRAHWNLAPRLKQESPSMERSIEQSSLAYFDDTDGRRTLHLQHERSDR